MDGVKTVYFSDVYKRQAFILATIEKKLHKVTPTWLDNLTTPLISIMVTSFLTFICVGPVDVYKRQMLK